LFCFDLALFRAQVFVFDSSSKTPDDYYTNILGELVSFLVGRACKKNPTATVQDLESRVTTKFVKASASFYPFPVREPA
jgi:hypothetical protein